MNMRRVIGWGVLIAVLIVLALLAFRWLRGDYAPAPVPPIGPIETVPDPVLVQDRPTAPPTGIKRITKRRTPARVQVSAGTPDRDRVDRFVVSAQQWDSVRRENDSLKAAVARGDTVAAAELRHPRPTPKKILPTASGEYDGKDFKLYLTRSDGSLLRATARLRPHWSFYSGYDKGTDTLPAFDQDSWWLQTGRQVVHCAPVSGVFGGLGYAVTPDDRWAGAAIGAGISLLSCIVG